jgi:hypothetical protein
MYRRLWTKMLVEWLYYTYKKWILVGRERRGNSGFRSRNGKGVWGSGREVRKVRNERGIA